MPAIIGSSATTTRPAGYAGLFAELGITTYLPQHRTSISSATFSNRTSEVDNFGRVHQVVPGRTPLDPTPGGHLLFAMKHDGVDLEALRLIFAKIDGAEVERSIRAQPASEPARRAWFLYEWMTGKTLDVPSPNRQSHVPLLDPERYVTCEQGRSSRHGIIVNCLGGPALCPTIRRSPEMIEQTNRQPLAQLDRFVSSIDASTAKRINGYLMTRESQGSFAIEGITSDSTKDEVFFALLNRIAQRPCPEINAKMLHDYQNHLIEGRDRELSGNYRQDQVWIGSRKGSMPVPEYIAPQAADVPQFMDAFCQMANWTTNQAQQGKLDPIAAGATNSAAFVYIHPFMDGNGRLSRLLLQQPLSQAPDADGKRLFLPISSAINRRRDDYYRALDTWSMQVMRNIRYTDNGSGGITPTHPTRDLYKYPDLTVYTEFIYQAANEAVTKDVPEERTILAVYDRTLPELEKAGLNEHKRDVFFRAAKDNNWKISKNKRGKFPEIPDERLAEIERIMLDAAAGPGERR